MVTEEQTTKIIVLARQGRSVRAIAMDMEISRKTIRRHLHQLETVPEYGPRPRRKSTLDPFKEGLRRRITEAVPRWIPVMVNLREICQQGYRGRISLLRQWLTGERLKEPESPVIRYKRSPGHQAQVNWAQFRGGPDRLSAFVCVLGYSRYAFVRFGTQAVLRGGGVLLDWAAAGQVQQILSLWSKRVREHLPRRRWRPKKPSYWPIREADSGRMEMRQRFQKNPMPALLTIP